VIVFVWPADGCPICRYFDNQALDFEDEVPDEPSACDCTAAPSA